MRKILVLVLFCLFTGLAFANLTVTTVPVTKTGGSTPAFQNGSITDTGTSSGAGNVGIGSTAPGSMLDIQGTARMIGIVVTGTSATNIGIGTAAYNHVCVKSGILSVCTP